MMREPDKSGVAKAWRIDPNAEQIQAHIESFGYPPTGIGPTWLIHGPYHPFWSWWYAALITLDEVPGVPSAHKQYPEARYELMIMSLNPGGNPDLGRPAVPDLEKLEAGDTMGGLPGFLTPPDLQYQFHGVDDEQAVAILETVVDAIVSGHSCDSDFRDWWRRSLDATVEHYEMGMHG